jgi:hypothetical protein
MVYFREEPFTRLQRPSDITDSPLLLLVRYNEDSLYFYTEYFKMRSTVKVVGFEVLIAVITKMPFFWDITLCSPLKVNRRFGGKCHLHFQGQRIRNARNQSPMPAKCFHAGFLLGLFLYPEDRGDMFLRNVGLLSTDYTALYSRR